MDRNFDLLREEMRAGFEGIRAEMAANRAEVIAFHRQIVYVVVTLWVGLLGLFAAQL